MSNNYSNGAASEDFSYSLKAGSEGEIKVAKFLREYFGRKILHFNDNSDYDIMTKKRNGKETIEVKTEYLLTSIKDTGNMAIEHQEQIGKGESKDSGIKVTNADIWCQLLINYDEAWFIPVEKLKELIENLKKSGDIYLSYGDASKNNPTNNFLINRKLAFSHFEVYNIKTGERITDVEDIKYYG
jgi:hypothetical protein